MQTQDDSRKITEDDLNERQTLLVEIMGKHTLLVSIAMISSAITLTIFVTRMFFNSDSDTSHLLYLWFHFLLIIDACVNCVCLILQFSFSNTIFDSLCKHGHTWCTRLFVKHTVAQLVHLHSNHSNLFNTYKSKSESSPANG